MVGAHALGGVVRVRAYHPPAPSLAPGRRVWLERRGEQRKAVIHSAARHRGGLVLVGFEGVEDRAAAEALVGSTVLVPQDELPALEKGEFYHHQLLGFDVETVGGEHLGRVAGTLTTGLNDVWIVQKGRQEYLIPIIADVVRAIDRGARRIVIEPMPGLLD